MGENGSIVLRATGVTVRYGGVTAVHDVSLDVSAGEVLGLIGPNGAGKTTLIDAVSGFVSIASGSITLAGRRIDKYKPHQRARAGLTRTFQQLELFNELTVAENLASAARASARSGHERLEQTVETLGLDSVLERSVAELSQGQRRLVAVARAVATDPQVVLLDEPAAGLDADDSRVLEFQIDELRAAGTAVVLVDHDMSFVLSTCDRVVVLDFGAVLATGTPGEIRSDPAVIEAYLGAA